MPKVIIPPGAMKRLLRKRRAWGGDRYDEVWNGVYVFMPLGDNEHQGLATKLAGAIDQGTVDREGIHVFAGVNVSDRPDDWRKNYRCPDVAVFLPENPAEDRETHWLGGPDFAVEIMSPYDRSRQKFGFYAKVGARELLLVDRRPWCLELHRRRDREWDLVGESRPEQPAVLSSAVLPLTFRLVASDKRPWIEVGRADGAGRWLA